MLSSFISDSDLKLCDPNNFIEITTVDEDGKEEISFFGNEEMKACRGACAVAFQHSEKIFVREVSPDRREEIRLIFCEEGVLNPNLKK